MEEREYPLQNGHIFVDQHIVDKLIKLISGLLVSGMNPCQAGWMT